MVVPLSPQVFVVQPVRWAVFLFVLSELPHSCDERVLGHVHAQSLSEICPPYGAALGYPWALLLLFLGSPARHRPSDLLVRPRVVCLSEAPCPFSGAFLPPLGLSLEEDDVAYARQQ